MREEIKKRGDRQRFLRYGGMELVEELVLELPEKTSYSRGHVLETAMQIARRKIKRKGKQRRLLAETIVRYAFGEGYLFFQNNKYFLTKKSKKLRKERHSNS